jgi:mannose-1-phosphate guanylyltransferase/mannose-6-phosphate isomerase
MSKIVPVVLSGGAGTRLWPASRRRQPKQLLPLAGDRSMFQTTIERTATIADVAAPIVVSNADQRALIQRDLASAGFTGARIILEPIGRNTAPAAAVAALELTADGDDPLMLVLPADHVIGDEAALAEAVGVAVGLGDDGYLVTFGVNPTHAETGYGYIEVGDPLDAGGMVVESFREKPDAETAERYLAAGSHLWNSGMFLFRARRYLDELGTHEPDALASATAAYQGAKEHAGVITLDEAAFSQSPSISIDYAVMEPTEGAAVVPLDAGWSDVGSWEALWELGEPDQDGNVISGDVELLDVANSYIRSSDRLIAAIGLDDVVIVDSPDATLIVGRDRAQDVRVIVDRLEAAHRPEVETDGTESRPWGGFTTLLEGQGFRVLRLWIEPGGKTSLTTHDHRSEYWIVVRGIARIKLGDTTRLVPEEDSVFVPAGEVHSLENPSTEEILEVVEVDVGSYVVEDDTKRYADAHGRAEPKA